MLDIHTIVHPTDFSAQSCYAFRLACALARDHGARLVVVHVYHPLAAVYGEGVMLHPDFVDEEEVLQAKLTRLEPADASIAVERRLLEGDPVEEILRLTEKLHGDLIVMGTHGRTGLGRLLMGSVAEAIARKAPCPVLTVKTPIPETAEVAAKAECATAF